VKSSQTAVNKDGICWPPWARMGGGQHGQEWTGTGRYATAKTPCDKERRPEDLVGRNVLKTEVGMMPAFRKNSKEDG